jgi:membrane protein GlpM
MAGILASARDAAFTPAALRRGIVGTPGRFFWCTVRLFRRFDPVLLFFKCLLGALAVLVIALLSKTRNFYLAGLVPLFPTFALIAHYIVGTERSMADLRTTALFGLASLAPYAVYLAAVYLLALRLALPLTLTIATLAWCAAAGVLVWAWPK